ncbi:MAG TPA: heme exporter protein CcmD [Burkholderiales bacterium]|jgi:heme exporter protein CcmD
MSHGFFIWASYGVTFAALALEVALLLRRSRNSTRQADKMPE